MTDPLLMTALLAATPPTFVSGVALFIAIRNTQKQEEIHVLVNSNLTHVKSELSVALNKIVSLEKFIIEKQ